jgi:hypothetical protein
MKVSDASVWNGRPDASGSVPQFPTNLSPRSGRLPAIIVINQRFLHGVGPWVGLASEILLLLSDDFDLSLKSYCRVRGVCTAWHARDAPPRRLMPS